VADEVINDDVFIEADHVVVDGTVNGVLIVSANTAEINGDLAIVAAKATVSGLVADNLMFGGQALTLDGTVGGSLFSAGSSVTLEPSATVERSVLFGGFGFAMESGSKAGRDLHLGGYQALLAGQIGGNLDAGVQTLDLEGTIAGDVTVGVPQQDAAQMFRWLEWPGKPKKMAPSGLRVSEAAQVGGTFTYESPVEQADAIDSASMGDIVFEQAQDAVKAESTIILDIQHHLVERIREFLALLVLGGLVAWRMPRLLERLAEQARTKPIPAAL
jgi:hypothetical protein